MNGVDFNESNYLAANPDVADALKLGQFRSGYEHYQSFGKEENWKLDLNGKMSREEKALFQLDKNGIGLEIGPSHNPIAPKKKGFNVHILDHLNANELRKKYEAHDVNIENIEEVDFVWSGESLPELTGVRTYYDWIIASHVIEHVPDLVSLLQQCTELLKPDGKLS